MEYRVDKIDAMLIVTLVAMDRNFIRGTLMDETANKELATVNYNFTYEHPQVVFTAWAKESGWTRNFNKDWNIHDAVRDKLIEKGIVPESVRTAFKQTHSKQEKPQQTAAPKPQTEVSKIVKSKVKVAQASSAKQEQKEVKIQKPQKAENIVMMSDEELEKEIHKISDFENDFVDPDLL